MIIFLGRHGAGYHDARRLSDYFAGEEVLTPHNMKAILRICKAKRLLFAHSSLPNLILIFLFFWKERHLVVHNTPKFCSRLGIKGIYDRILFLTNLNLARRFYFLSKEVMESYPKLLRHATLINNFVKPSPALRVITDTSKILFFGRNLPYKNAEAVYRAAALLPHRKFTIAGHGFEYESTSNCEVINGYLPQSQVEDLYSDHDILLLPYLEVTQSGPFFLGLENGLVCVVSNLPFFKSFSEMNGVYFLERPSVDCILRSLNLL
jgi:glycosyltransferase involved in cell wall biosynthesis